MQLYVDSGFLSPYAMSAYVALRVKGLAPDLITVDLEASENLSDRFFVTSATSRVPTLVDEDFSLSESSAIAEYLEDKMPSPNLYPRSMRERAKARQVQAWLRSDLMALRQERPTNVIFVESISSPLSAAALIAKNKLIRAAIFLLKNSGGHLFESWSIADTDLALMLKRLVANDDSIPESLIDYADRQWHHPAIQEWVALSRATKA